MNFVSKFLCQSTENTFCFIPIDAKTCFDFKGYYMKYTLFVGFRIFCFRKVEIRNSFRFLDITIMIFLLSIQPYIVTTLTILIILSNINLQLQNCYNMEMIIAQRLRELKSNLYYSFFYR